jgi:hypothetical protein
LNFKYLKYFLFLIVLFISCDDIERDNILDPKNPSSERPQIITIEAFVNTAANVPNALNDTLLMALTQINNSYNDKISILEYHRNTTNFNDSLFYNKNESLYNIYTGGVNKGVPDVFINGTAARIQGASTVRNSVFRIEEALQSLLVNTSYFTIEPNITQSNNEINVSLKVAKLGSTDALNVLVKAVVLYRIDNYLLKRVVYGIGKSTIISEFNNGEIKDIIIDPIDLAPFQYDDISVICMVTSEDEKSIYQSIRVDIP